MGRRGTLDSAPSAIVAEFNRLVRAGWTIDAIRQAMADLGQPISHGAAGRAVKKAREQIEALRESQEIAGMWVQQLGENPHGDVGMMVAEVLKVVAHLTSAQMLDQAQEGKKPVKAMELMLLTQAVKNLENTAKQSMDRRERIERAVLSKQAEAAEVVAKELGLSTDGWDKIRARFLGIDQEEPPA